jgi:hypothetical protein
MGLGLHCASARREIMRDRVKGGGESLRGCLLAAALVSALCGCGEAPQSPQSAQRAVTSSSPTGIPFTWGTNASGELGGGTTVGSRQAPGAVVGITNVTAVSAGASHNLAILSDTTVWAWGNNVSGQLGTGATENETAPVRSGASIDFKNATAVAGGGAFSLALRSDGTVWAWGTNLHFELGTPTAPQLCSGEFCNPVPAQVASLSGVIAIAAGSEHALALCPTTPSWDGAPTARGSSAAVP